VSLERTADKDPKECPEDQVRTVGEGHPVLQALRAKWAQRAGLVAKALQVTKV